MGWRPFSRPLLLELWPMGVRVVHAVDAFLALALAEGALAAIALAITFALPSWLAVALSAIFSFAFAWLLVLASALACTEGGAMAFASAITANLGTRLAAHAGRGRAQPLRVASSKAIIALEGRPWSRIFALALAFLEGVYLASVLGGRPRGPSRG